MSLDPNDKANIDISHGTPENDDAGTGIRRNVRQRIRPPPLKPVGIGDGAPPSVDDVRPAKKASIISAPDDTLEYFARAVADRIEHLSVAVLKPFNRRTRTHSDDQISLIMGSFAAFGVINPLIIDEGGVVLAGSARLEAAKRKGINTLPVVRVSHLTDDEKRAYVIADNRIAERAGWDVETLAVEFEYLSGIDLGFDIDVLGFSVTEIDLVIGEANQQEPEADPADDLPALSETAVTHKGDIWLLGRHKVICGDALDANVYTAIMGEQRPAWL